MSRSKIAWTDHVWNPVTGCTPVSAGCLNCYAERDVLSKRGNFSKVVCHYDRLSQPMLWKGALRVFVNSLSDLFHAAVPFEFVDEVINVIKRCPQHQFQVLTKRPSRMAEFLSRLNDPVIPNLWVGVSVEDQRSANERISELVKVPAAVRFVSIEPLLGPVDLSMIPNPGFGEGQSWYDALKRLAWVADPSGYYDGCSVGVGLDWVIVGGESGPKARECDIAWIKSVVTQCRESGVACFVKQDSGPHSGLQGRIPNDLWRVRQFPSGE